MSSPHPLSRSQMLEDGHRVVPPGGQEQHREVWKALHLLGRQLNHLEARLAYYEWDGMKGEDYRSG